MPRELKAPPRAPEIKKKVSWGKEQGTVTISLEMALSQTSHGYFETSLGFPHSAQKLKASASLQKALCSSWRRNKMAH